jgi:uncharacterized protein YkwD
MRDYPSRMARPWGPISFAALALLAAATFTDAAAARTPASRNVCKHHTHAKGCANKPLDKRTGRAKAVQVAAPAAVAADGSCANSGLRTRASNLPQIDAAVLCLINRQRTIAGLPPLRASSRLATAAQRHSNDMARAGYFDHTGPGGDTVGRRIAASGYLQPGRAAVLGENIAWVTTASSTPAAMVADWLVSPEHRANLFDPGFRDSGIGIAIAPPAAVTSGVAGVDVTEDFGRIG